MKKNGDNSNEDEHTWSLGNSCSTNPAPEVIVTEREDNGPQKDDLQRIIELMDGFKASKVNQRHT